MTIDGKEYDLVCDGYIGSKCEPPDPPTDDPKDCNHDFHYVCADWTEQDAGGKAVAAGFKCQDPHNCDQTVTIPDDEGASHDYDIVCKGYIG